MGWGGQYGGWAPYVPAAVKRSNGILAASKLAKKEGRTLQPAKAKGRKLATTFWGLKWCENLEQHRDFANRLPRGATYARNGSIVDLVIEPGAIRALVAGSTLYKIRIDIKTLTPTKWKSILETCSQEIHSLLDLLSGRLSDGVMRRLTSAKDGLFPKSDEISMSCDCPDGAYVCKHVAAVFYGVAARLDDQPDLLFKLRNVDHMELLRRATKSENVDRAFGDDTQSGLTAGDLESIFGIELEGGAADAPPAARKTRVAKKKVAKKAPKKKAKKKPAKKAAKKAPPKKRG